MDTAGKTFFQPQGSEAYRCYGKLGSFFYLVSAHMCSFMLKNKAWFI